MDKLTISIENKRVKINNASIVRKSKDIMLVTVDLGTKYVKFTGIGWDWTPDFKTHLTTFSFRATEDSVGVNRRYREDAESSITFWFPENQKWWVFAHSFDKDSFDIAFSK